MATPDDFIIDNLKGADEGQYLQMMISLTFIVGLSEMLGVNIFQVYKTFLTDSEMDSLLDIVLLTDYKYKSVTPEIEGAITQLRVLRNYRDGLYPASNLMSLIPPLDPVLKIDAEGLEAWLRGANREDRVKLCMSYIMLAFGRSTVVPIEVWVNEAFQKILPVSDFYSWAETLNPSKTTTLFYLNSQPFSFTEVPADIFFAFFITLEVQGLIERQTGRVAGI